jgi:Interferon-induced transmembrane protein
MTQQNRDGEDDWGSSTDWQRPAQQPPPANPGWSQPAAQPPQQGYGPPPGYGGQPPYGPPPAYQPAPPPHPHGWPAAVPPPNYLVPAILVTLLCFLPTGFAAIYYSNQVTAKHNVGDFPGALDASNKTKMWCFVSLAVGLVLWFLVVASSGY